MPFVVDVVLCDRHEGVGLVLVGEFRIINGHQFIGRPEPVMAVINLAERVDKITVILITIIKKCLLKKINTSVKNLDIIKVV